MDGCNTTFLLGRPIFRGYVSFREAILKQVNFLSRYHWVCHIKLHPPSSKNTEPVDQQGTGVTNLAGLDTFS